MDQPEMVSQTVKYPILEVLYFLHLVSGPFHPYSPVLTTIQNRINHEYLFSSPDFHLNFLTLVNVIVITT